MRSFPQFTHSFASFQCFRPGFPYTVLEHLRRNCGLLPRHATADICCGTGAFSQLLAANGYRVIGVEANDTLRAIAEKRVGRYGSFQTLKGSAERTRLADQSVDFVSIAHRFDQLSIEHARAEFQRILRPAGSVLLLLNAPKLEGSDFMTALQLLYGRFRCDRGNSGRASCFQSSTERLLQSTDYSIAAFDNTQRLSFEQFRGLLLSESIFPEPQHERFFDLLDAIDELYARFESDNTIALELETTVVHKQLEAPQSRTRATRVRAPRLRDDDFSSTTMAPIFPREDGEKQAA
ncbi:MAG: class I SAM-dependent methyltransferase [Bdellovibrionales bacterium]|nr:class I SAM-dependent methyltransferase [Bdellovibrionales bacterium]